MQFERLVGFSLLPTKAMKMKILGLSKTWREDQTMLQSIFLDDFNCYDKHRKGITFFFLEQKDMFQGKNAGQECHRDRQD